MPQNATIPEQGRKITYRGYIIHGEIPDVCYTMYGRNPEGNLAELGTTVGFRDAMEWVDLHIAQMRSGWIPLQNTA